MRMTLRKCCAALVLLFVAACSDSPVGPGASARTAAPSETGAYIPGGPGECDPWLSADWCRDEELCPTALEPGTGDPFAVQSCPGGGEPVGGGPSPPATEPPSPDSCETQNTVVDDPVVQAGFKDLWQRSRINEPQAQRLETAAWIVRNADGTHRLVELSYSQRGPCNVNGNWSAPPGAIGYVHTHPFAAGEEMVVCGALKRPLPGGGWADIVRPDGRPVYERYNNQPSWPDREMITEVINRVRKARGEELLDAYIIDNERITRYTMNGVKDVVYGRCGY